MKPSSRDGWRALAAAAAGYVLVLIAGWILSGFADQDRFGGLAVAALTVVFAAPLGALAGSALVVARRRRDILPAHAQRLLVAGAVVVALITAGMLAAGSAFGVTALLLGATALLILRAVLLKNENPTG